MKGMLGGYYATLMPQYADNLQAVDYIGGVFGPRNGASISDAYGRGSDLAYRAGLTGSAPAFNPNPYGGVAPGRSPVFNPNGMWSRMRYSPGGEFDPYTLYLGGY